MWELSLVSVLSPLPKVAHHRSRPALVLLEKQLWNCGCVSGCAEDGHVYTIDVSESFVSIGKEHWKKAQVDHKITSILQSAEEAVEQLRPQHEGTFDMAYLDCPKHLYCQVSLQL